MRITILALGSRGDVQPYIALGCRLQQRGHRVMIGAFGDFQSSAQQAGLAFTSLGDLPSDARRGPGETRGPGSARLSGFRGRFFFWRWLSKYNEANASRFIEACYNADLIVHSRLATPAPHIAEAMAVPCIAAYAAPVTPTRHFAHPGYSRQGREWRLWIAASYRLDRYMTWHVPHRSLNRVRKQLGLEPLRRGERGATEKRILAYLYTLSPSVVPRPADWPVNTHVTGFWHERDETPWRPPAALEKFLDAGPPPLAIGFGSMLPQDSDAATRMIADALERTGTRAVLLSGWGNLNTSGVQSDRMFTLATAPHSWLFPRAVAAIHHGGAGTCAAALRAGIPSIVVPFAFDQPFWGRRLHQLGVAVPPIPIGTLSANRLVAAIDRITRDPAITTSARRLASALALEDGVERASALIEAYATRFAQASPLARTDLGRHTAVAFTNRVRSATPL